MFVRIPIQKFKLIFVFELSKKIDLFLFTMVLFLLGRNRYRNAFSVRIKLFRKKQEHNFSTLTMNYCTQQSVLIFILTANESGATS
jgi:hypothetical protein